MAFKTLNNYNEEKFGKFFLLKNDGDSADVIFLYHSTNDVLVADVHYIKSADYSGYAHCTGRGCPACAKGIRTQTKIFIPVYNIQAKEIQFWDRTTRFEPQLQNDVFKNYPDPANYVFRITRKGVPNDVNTTYSIQAVAKNTVSTLEEILAAANTSFPAHYEVVCKDLPTFKMSEMLSNTESSNSGAPMGDYATSYGAAPRAAAPAVETPTVVPPVYSEPPTDLPTTSVESEVPFEEDLADPEF